MGMYEEITPASYIVPSIIHPGIENNYQSISDFIWAELNSFLDEQGNSRVFFNMTTSATDVDLNIDCISLNPNPSSGLFRIAGALDEYHIEILNSSGVIYDSLDTSSSELVIDIQDLPLGLYFIRMQNKSNLQISLVKILKQ